MSCPVPRRALHLLIAGLLAPTLPAGAAVFNFTGASSANWATAANWAEGMPASAVDTELVLNAAARPSSFNDIAGGLVLNRLTLGALAGAPVISGNTLNFQGSSPLLQMLSTGGNALVQTPITLPGTLTVQGGASTASQLFLQGAISGAGGLTLASGLAVLSGNNSYSGATSVASGAVLGVAGNGLAGSSGVTVATGGELQFVNSNVITTQARPVQLSGLLSSSAKMINGGFGPVPSAVQQGAVTLTADARIHAFAATGTGVNSTSFTVSGVVDRAGRTLTLTTGGANNVLTLSGGISGAGGLVLQPAGGSVAVGNVSGNGDLRVQGAGGSVTLGAVAGDGALLVAYDTAANGSASVTGVLSGARPIDVTRGLLVLGNAAHSFSGLITLRSAGGLTAVRDSQLGNAANTLRFDGGGLLSFSDGSGGLARAIFTTGGNGTVSFASIGTRTISSTISGDGGITFNGTGSVLTLSGSNSFAGGLGVGPSTVVAFQNDGNLGAAGGGIALSGTLAMPAGQALSRPLTLNTTSAMLSGSGNHLISGAISGSGRLNLAGDARYTLTGNASHSGGVSLFGTNAGQSAVLVLDSDSRLGAATGVLNIGRSSGAFIQPGTLEAAADLNIAATRSTSFRDMTVDTAGHTVVFNQPINGLGMNKAGAGTWRLNTANGNTSADNPVQVLQGTLQLGVAEALGDRALVTVADGAVLDLDGRSQTLNSLNTAAGSQLQLGGNSATVLAVPAGGTVAGSINGQGRLSVGRVGNSFNSLELALLGASSFSGGVDVINGGRLSLGHAQALGAAGNRLLLDNGVVSADFRSATPIVLGSGLVLQIGSGGAGFMSNGQTLVVDTTLTGTAPLRFIGGSTPGDAVKTEVRLMNAGNSFAGDIQLGDTRGFGNATLGLAADGALGHAGNRVLLGHTFFNGETESSTSGGLRALGDLQLPASRSIILNGSSDDPYSGFVDTNGHSVVLQGGIGQARSSLALLKTGEGTLVMNGVNSYTGATRVEQGTLGGHGELQSLQIEADATLAPGQSAGLLTVRGNLAFNAGLLAMELGGTGRGNGYDALDVGGGVNLGDATLVLSFIGGFEAGLAGSQSFLLLDAAGPINGSFANVADGARLDTADGLGSFVVRYGSGQDLVISDFQPAAAVPEPAGWGLMALGLLGLAARRGRNTAA